MIPGTTVGKVERVDIQQVHPEELERFLAWAHRGASPDELAIIKDEYLQRQRLVDGPLPLVATLRENWVAGAYFTCLPGRLAMLGAVRAIDGCLALGSSLLKSLADRLGNELPILQIQAAVREADQAARQMLDMAGFQPLTVVDQIWLALPSNQQNSAPESTARSLDRHDFSQESCQPNGKNHLDAVSARSHRLNWSPARLMEKKSFIDLLMATFEETMDCPELNGLRSGAEVLASFLMGQNLDSMNLWEIAWCEAKPVGCLMLTEHPNGVIEVAYMGLIRSARGQGFGRLLIERAKQVTSQLGSTTLVLAVDCRNTPALKTYTRSGFQHHQRLQVYYLPLAIRLSNDHLMT